ncbi:MAG: flagellar motor switch protein FliM [Planctomycetes bacterium]|nr:flagellar motor switch protein FliM [Planctomycetota bacterium]
MPDEILSAEELESLLSTVEETGAGKRKREKRISEYDFVRPNKLSGEQLRALQRMHEAIAQTLTMALSTYLRINLEVNIVSLGELTFEVFRNSLPNPTVINVLSLAPLPERALATMDMKLAFSLIDRMMGGPGKPLDKMRPLTTIEQSLLENVIRRFLDRVAEGWAELAEFKPIVEAREMDPQFVQVIPSSEMVLVSTFSIAAPGELEPGELCFCIPFISIDTVMQRLGNRFRFAAMKRDPSEGQRRHLDRVVKHTTLPVRAELGTASVPVSQVMAMKPGDVIVLDQRLGERAHGLVGGKLRFLCSHGRLGKAVAVRVERVLPPGKTPHDKD